MMKLMETIPKLDNRSEIYCESEVNSSDNIVFQKIKRDLI